MSTTENRLPEPEPEEEEPNTDPAVADATVADPSDTEGTEGDPPIIITGGS
jgi:hypothetical protein